MVSVAGIDCSEIATVTQSVRDLARTRHFYASVFGYVPMASGPVPPEAAAAWKAPAGCRAEYVVLGRPRSRRGLLRLVAFDRPGEPIWGTYERPQDYGHYATNYRVPSVHATWEKLVAAGVKPKSPPTHWHVDETMAAWDSQCWDLDGTLLDVYQMEGRPDLFPDLGGDAAGEIETMAIHVESADRSRRFYEAIGYTLLFDKTIDDLGAFFHLPQGVALRDVNLYKPDRSPIGRIELVELVGHPGRPVRERAVPPNHGILSLSFVAGDLGAVREAVARGGGEATTPDYRTAAPVFGPARAFNAVGPDGEALEFIQPDA